MSEPSSSRSTPDQASRPGEHLGPPRPRTPYGEAPPIVSERVAGPMDGSSSGLSGLRLRPQRPEEPAGRADRVSVAALVTGIVGLWPVAIGLGVAGLMRTKKPGVGGRRYAQGGLALGAVWALGWAAVLVFALFVGQSLGGSSAGAASSVADAAASDGTTKSGSEVEQGDCLLAWDASTLGDTDPDVVAVDCTSPHQAQAFGEVDLSDTYADGAPYPGVAAVVDAGTAGCRTQVASSLVDTAQSLAVSAIPPTAADWANGARTVMCLVVSGAADLKASVTL